MTTGLLAGFCLLLRKKASASRDSWIAKDFPGVLVLMARCSISASTELELELKLILIRMIQKPMLRIGVCALARAYRASPNQGPSHHK